MSDLQIGMDTYRVDRFPLPAVTDTNPCPLDLAIGGEKVWLCCEFDKRIYSLPLASATGTPLTAHTVPTPSTPLFRSRLFGQDSATHMTASEDLDIGPDGKVWFTQCGDYLYDGPHANYSRVVSYDPATQVWQAYLIPWNRPGAMGIYYEHPTGRLWVALGNPHGGSALICTRPYTWLPQDTSPTDLVSTVLSGIARGTDRRGWRVVAELPGVPAQVVPGADGRLFVTLYWGNALMAVDRETGATQRYSLPPAGAGAMLGSAGPWQLDTDWMGQVWTACDYTRQVMRVAPATGAVTVHDLAGLTPDEHPHTVVFDRKTSIVWWTAYTTNPPPDNAGRIGRIRAGVIEYSPPLTTVGIRGGATGVVIDAADAIWVACFMDKSIIKLTEV